MCETVTNKIIISRAHHLGFCAQSTQASRVKNPGTVPFKSRPGRRFRRFRVEPALVGFTVGRINPLSVITHPLSLPGLG